MLPAVLLLLALNAPKPFDKPKPPPPPALPSPGVYVQHWGGNPIPTTLHPCGRWEGGSFKGWWAIEVPDTLHVWEASGEHVLHWWLKVDSNGEGDAISTQFPFTRLARVRMERKKP